MGFKLSWIVLFVALWIVAKQKLLIFLFSYFRRFPFGRPFVVFGLLGLFCSVAVFTFRWFSIASITQSVYFIINTLYCCENRWSLCSVQHCKWYRLFWLWVKEWVNKSERMFSEHCLLCLMVISLSMALTFTLRTIRNAAYNCSSPLLQLCEKINGKRESERKQRAQRMDGMCWRSKGNHVRAIKMFNIFMIHRLCVNRNTHINLHKCQLWNEFDSNWL